MLGIAGILASTVVCLDCIPITISSFNAIPSAGFAALISLDPAAPPLFPSAAVPEDALPVSAGAFLFPPHPVRLPAITAIAINAAITRNLFFIILFTSLLLLHRRLPSHPFCFKNAQKRLQKKGEFVHPGHFTGSTF